MELLNRTPSPELLAEVRGVVEANLQDLPVERLTVRVIQPGRTRIVTGHVLVPAGANLDLARMDEARTRTDAALKADHPTTTVDLVFTSDPRWSAPTTF
jgi:predicted Co/Zn/Cd cation transporter (cation efflux family)